MLKFFCIQGDIGGGNRSKKGFPLADMELLLSLLT